MSTSKENVCIHHLQKEENVFSGRYLLFPSVPDTFRRHNKYEVDLKPCFGVTSEAPKDPFTFQQTSLIFNIINIFFKSFFQENKRNYCNGETYHANY
jgi:hypothetical protein